MPELPEVETVRRQLEDRLRGREVESVEVHEIKSVSFDPDFATRLTDKVFDNIARIGKLLIFSFRSEEDFYLLVHLKMTGQLIFVDEGDHIFGGGHSLTDSERTLPHKHTRVIINLVGGARLFFNDLRKFGYMRIATHNEMMSMRESFGPEPIDKDFDCAGMYENLKKRVITIKAFLLDQSQVAGLGNIYVDEALFRAGVRPDRACKTITKEEGEKICRATREVLNEAIFHKGTTFKDFIDSSGKKGNFTKKLKVFGKQGKPCSICGQEIQKSRVAGRGTHFCLHCQK